MAQSYSQLYIHLTFHVANTGIQIFESDKQDLYDYIGNIIRKSDSVPIIINGTINHIHIFCSLSKKISVAQLVSKIKSNSTLWMKDEPRHYKKFEWQSGYAAFSVSPSLYNKTREYIRNQETHHKKMTFQEELQLFLKEYNIDYKPDLLIKD